jgi:hypothetical protein
METLMNSAKQAMENMEYVRGLLGQEQPGFAASLEFAVSLAAAWRNRWMMNSSAVRGGGPRRPAADDSAVPELVPA